MSQSRHLRFVRFAVALCLVLVGLASAFTISNAFSDSTDDHSPIRSLASTATENRASLLDPAKVGEPLPKNLFVELNKLINPAVVSISTSTLMRQRYRGQDPLQQFMQEFLGGRSPYDYQAPQVAQALGTGFIIRQDGLIITNNHVVQAADEIKVQLELKSKKFFDAKIIGRDERTDIALIKIDAGKTLPTAILGSSAKVEVGEWVAAFGNPYGHAHTMTKGIVSALGREINEINKFPFIQTDASINPGNSGGPLVNTQGLVIGVNTAIDARAQGIGFAIPIDNVKTIVAELEKNGRIKRGYIGVAPADLNPQVAQSLGLENLEGSIITQIDPNGPAAKGGIRLYDVITEFAGKKITSATNLVDTVSDTEIGNKVKVTLLRAENDQLVKKVVEVKIGDKPEAGSSHTVSVLPKSVQAQKLPFAMGFRVSDWSPQLAQELGVANSNVKGPLVVDIEADSNASRAGLQAGDVLLDVNRQSVRKASDVAHALKAGSNFLRIFRDGATSLIVINTNAGK